VLEILIHILIVSLEDINLILMKFWGDLVGGIKGELS